MERELSVYQWAAIMFLGIAIVWTIWSFAFAAGDLAIGLGLSIFFAGAIYLFLLCYYRNR